MPLTNSLYVPGKPSDTEYVIVDVGTGYYVKKVRVARSEPFLRPCCALICFAAFAASSNFNWTHLSPAPIRVPTLFSRLTPDIRPVHKR